MNLDVAAPLPEQLLSYGRVKWDRRVWECMLPSIRAADGATDEMIAKLVHSAFEDVFARLELAAAALSDVQTAMLSLDRKATTLKAELFIPLDDFRRLQHQCDSIIWIARNVRSDPVNVAQAAILLEGRI